MTSYNCKRFQQNSAMNFIEKITSHHRILGSILGATAGLAAWKWLFQDNNNNKPKSTLEESTNGSLKTPEEVNILIVTPTSKIDSLLIQQSIPLSRKLFGLSSDTKKINIHIINGYFEDNIDTDTDPTYLSNARLLFETFKTRMEITFKLFIFIPIHETEKTDTKKLIKRENTTIHKIFAASNLSHRRFSSDAKNISYFLLPIIPKINNREEINFNTTYSLSKPIDSYHIEPPKDFKQEDRRPYRLIELFSLK